MLRRGGFALEARIRLSLRLLAHTRDQGKDPDGGEDSLERIIPKSTKCLPIPTGSAEQPEVSQKCRQTSQHKLISVLVWHLGSALNCPALVLANVEVTKIKAEVKCFS